MTIQEKAMLIYTNSVNNNYKFYELILHEDGTLNMRWGRVEDAGQSKTTNGGKHEFESKLREKLAKGYVRSSSISVVQDNKTVEKSHLAETAKRDILGDSAGHKDSVLMNKLIERLSDMNRHQIMAASNGKIQVDESGLVMTALGLVTSESVSEARKILKKIEPYIKIQKCTDSKYISLLDDYLKLIPQRVPRRRGWYETFFTDSTNINLQSLFLDQLEGSIDLYKTKEDDIRKQLLTSNGVSADEVFRTKLVLLEDTTVWKKIEKFYKESLNKSHVSAHLKLKNIFVVQNEDWTSRYSEVAKKIGNEMFLWHGTRAFNILSIFKRGLIVPNYGSTFQITARMFGDGLYFSDQSSKSLNYSYGYWDNGTKDNNCFMFLADVAMGKSYTPSGSIKTISNDYNSTFAKANKSNVMNNEMIVYDVNQANLRYLCEFSEK